MIRLHPINNRYKRLINEFGADWRVIAGPKPMDCFGGQLGVTCTPCAKNLGKVSNFKNDEVTWIKV